MLATSLEKAVSPMRAPNMRMHLSVVPTLLKEVEPVSQKAVGREFSELGIGMRSDSMGILFWFLFF